MSQFWNGTAFLGQSDAPSDFQKPVIPVGKSWSDLGAEAILVESVDWEAVAAALLTSDKESSDQYTFTIDYTIINSNITSNFTFSAGQTYWVQPSASNPSAPGGFILTGSVVFQPGAVIKYNRYSNLYFTGQVSTGTGNAPVIFTAADDNSIGAVVSTSPLSGQYASCAIFGYNDTYNITLNRCHFRFCQTAVRYNASGSGFIYSQNLSRFDNCGTAIYGSSSFPVTVKNPTFYAVTTQSVGSLVAMNYTAGAYSTSPSDRFTGIPWTLSPQSDSVPDTMGAVGPDYIVEAVNRRIAIYPRGSSTSSESIDVADFFSAPSTDIPKDTRVIFDQISQRWYIIAIRVASGGNIEFAYTANASPVGLGSSNWMKLTISTG